MKGKIYLVDSNIIIYHLNDEIVATNFLDKHLDECAISQLSFIEILSFDYTSEEKTRVKALLELFKIIDTSKEISLEAIKNREMKKIKIADNIIAATAQVHNLILVTRNKKDFTHIDIKILNPFEINSC